MEPVQPNRLLQDYLTSAAVGKYGRAMTTAQMWIVLGVGALLAGIAIIFWLVVARADRRNRVPRCEYCTHPRAAHNGTGCRIRIAITGGTKPCLCTAPYGEGR